MGTFQSSLRWLLCPFAAYMLATTGCSFTKDTAANIIIPEVMDGKMNRGSHCNLLQVECQEQFYREWQTPDGERMCTCDNKSA
ncbi:hypothetical protein [Teredinibacter franksiae]|uniref:hypothetical protein n=1 Tax=Teredinibacter franksiae TaxID=2761453 RepID=UPI001625CAD8|nr:hypothetical protein [Teredinibacter franksiae]